MRNNSLKAIRKQRRITLQQLAEATGYAISSLSNYENGRADASPEFIDKVAEALHVPVEAIEREMQGGGTPSIPVAPGWKKIPVISWVAAGTAGNFSDFGAELDDYIVTNSKDPNAFGLIIEGASMEPEFRGGDLVVVEPNATARNGDY